MTSWENPYESPDEPGVTRRPAQSSGRAKASLVLGLAGMISWCFPPLGFPMALAGLLLGKAGLQSDHRPWAIAGLLLSILAIALSIAAAASGWWLTLWKLA